MKTIQITAEPINKEFWDRFAAELLARIPKLFLEDRSIDAQRPTGPVSQSPSLSPHLPASGEAGP